MDTSLLMAKDTIVTADTIVLRVLKMTESCVPCVTESKTNCIDLWIVIVICLTILALGFLAKNAFLSWQKENKSKELNDKKLKSENEIYNKSKEHLKDRLLDFLEKNTYEEVYCEKQGKMIKKQKGLSDSDSKYYLNVLRQLIDSSIPENNQPSEDNPENEKKGK